MALLGIGVPLALGSPGVGFMLIALGVITAGLTLHAFLAQDSVSDQEPASLGEALGTAEAAGRRLLTEAAALQPGKVGVDDNLLRRAEGWVDGVSDALAVHGEQDMRERWINNPRWLFRPDPITREQWDRYVVGEIRERLALLREFEREIKARG